MVPSAPSLNDREASQRGLVPREAGPNCKVSYCLALQESEEHLCCTSLGRQVTVAHSSALKGKRGSAADAESSTHTEREKTKGNHLGDYLVNTIIFS